MIGEQRKNKLQKESVIESSRNSENVSETGCARRPRKTAERGAGEQIFAVTSSSRPGASFNIIAADGRLEQAGEPGKSTKAKGKQDKDRRNITAAQELGK